MKFLTRLKERLRPREYIQDILYGDTELTMADKRAIAYLISLDEFRKYEKYMQVKQRTRAKRLLYSEEKELPLLRRDVSMIAEMTADHKRIWNEVEGAKDKRTQKEKKPVKLFGKNRVSL